MFLIVLLVKQVSHHCLRRHMFRPIHNAQDPGDRLNRVSHPIHSAVALFSLSFSFRPSPSEGHFDFDS